MADEEHSLGAAFSGASATGEPAAKRPKICPVANNGARIIEPKHFSYVSEDKESWEPVVNCTQPAEKEAKPVMAVEKAPALGADNNGLGLGCESYRATVRLQHSGGLEAAEDDSGTEKQAIQGHCS